MSLQLMQQQTTVLSTSHGSYLSPGVTFSPCHIQQIGAVSLNGLPATPIAPASGTCRPRLAPNKEGTWAGPVVQHPARPEGQRTTARAHRTPSCANTKSVTPGIPVLRAPSQQCPAAAKHVLLSPV